MKLLKITIAFLALVSLQITSAQWVESKTTRVVVGGVVSAPAGGPNAWYGPSQNAYAGNQNDTTAMIQSVEVVSAGSATQLRVFVHEQQSTPSYVKLALYDAAGNNLLGSCTTLQVVDDTWMSCTMSSAVAVTSSTRYRIAGLVSYAMSVGMNSANSAYGFYQGSLTYAAFPPATLTSTDAADEDWCLNVYVD